MCSFGVWILEVGGFECAIAHAAHLLGKYLGIWGIFYIIDARTLFVRNAQ